MEFGIRITADGKVAVVEAGKVEQALGGIDKSAASTNSTLGNLTDTVKAAAAAFGAYKLYEYAKDAALLNARYETLGVSMTVVGKNAGYTSSQMDAAAQGMQKMGISMVESREQAMRLVQAHIDLADSQKLARIAQDAAVIGNMNSSEAFAAMIHGIQTGQPEVLRTIGLNVSMEQSYKVLASQLNIHADQLTQNQRTQAILNSVIAAGADIAGTYEAAMDTAGKQLNSMKRYTEDLKVSQGEVFNEVLTVGVMAYTAHLKESNAELRAMAANGELKAWGVELPGVFVGIANAIDNVMSMAKMAGTWAAHQSNITAIHGQFDEKKKSIGFFDTAAEAKWTDDLDAAIRAENATYEAAQVDLAGKSDRFQRAWDERQAANAAREAKDIADKADYLKRAQDAQARIADLFAKGEISRAEYLKGATGIQQAFYGDNHSYQDRAGTGAAKAKKSDAFVDDAAAKQAKEYESLYLAMVKYDEELDIQAGHVEKVSKGEDLWAKVTKNLNAAQIAVIEPLHQHIAASEKLVDTTAAYNAYVAAQIEPLEKQARAAEVSNETYGMTEAQIQRVTIARLDDAIAILEQEKAKAEAAGADQDELDRLQQWIDLYQREAAARNGIANNADVRKQRDQSVDMWKSIEGAAHSAFNNIEKGGKSVAQALHDAFKSGFYDYLYQMTVKKWIVNVSANMSSTNVAGAAFPNAGGISGVSGAGGGGLGGLSLNQTPFTDTLFSLNKSVGDVGGLFSQYGDSLYAGAKFLDSYGGYLKAGYDLTQGNYGSAAGTAIGMYFGGPIGAAIGGYLGGMLDGGGGEDPHNNPQVSGFQLGLSKSGVSSVGSTDAGNVPASFQAGPTSGSGWWGDSTALTPAQIAAINNQVIATFASGASIATILGVSASVLDKVSVSSLTDGTPSNGHITGYFATMDAAFAALSDDIAKTLLPNLADFQQSGETLSQTLMRVAGDMQTMDSITAHLGMTYSQSSDAATRAANAEKIIAAGGGAQAFGANLQAFYQSFYSDAERQANAQADLAKQFALLNIAMPTSKDQFRDLVTGLDLTSTSGQTLFGQLLALAPAFASVTDAASSATNAANKLADAQHQLYLGDLSPLASGQKLSVANTDLQDVYAKAMAGDATALDALPKSAQDFLTAARDFYASAPEYTAAFQEVQNMLETAKSVTIPGHASGLDAVPYDNYLMYAHKDEAVLTATDAADWRSGKGGITSEDLKALRADVQRLTAVVMAGDQANVKATKEVASTHRDIAWRSEARPAFK